MGVKGLTSFIAKHAEQYMKPFELHDCSLVIDGDNLACNLYKDVSNCNSAFGGDYDEYYRTVVNFFQLLKTCNVKSYVLLDGGYERKKMRTVQSRLRSKIGALKHINPSNSRPMFPLMMREVFVDALKDSGILFMRCELEADEELAALARCLNCPVLSYDSDFYVFNVKYIPLITLRMKVLEKKENKMNQRKELRACEARNLKKKQQMNQGNKICIESNEKKMKHKSKSIKYLDCCLYKIENLLEKGKLDREKLPLFAALLGNDYISVKCFNGFYSQVGMKGISKKIPKHQKRVMVILRWLRHETKDSAMEKILGRIKKEHREFLSKQMHTATNGYLNEKCISFDYFELTDKDRSSDSEFEEEDSDTEVSDTYEETCSLSDNIEENIFSSDEQDSDNADENAAPEEVLEEVLEIPKDAESNQDIAEQNTTDSAVLEDVKQKKQISDEMLKCIHSGSLPRYVIDLFNLYLYINSPQIENFLYPDCNEIAIPILLRIFAFLHYPDKPELRYLTRVVRLTNCVYKKIPTDAINLDKEKVLEEIFSHAKLSIPDLMQALAAFAEDITFYLSLLVYWANKSKYCDEFHIHALLICLVTLRFIDSKVEPIRSEKDFQKQHGKKIQKEKMLRLKVSASEKSDDPAANDSKYFKSKDILNSFSIPEKINFISKNEVILLQENLLKYFYYQPDNRKSHTTFSSTICHGFSEFQAIIFQMYTLNALLHYPFVQIKMSNLYSGIFLYNIYVNLQQRIDVQHHIKNFIFRDSDLVYEFYRSLADFCEKFIPSFKAEKVISETNISKKIKKKILQKNKKNTKTCDNLIEKLNDMISNEECSGNDDVVLLNNNFGVLSI